MTGRKRSAPGFLSSRLVEARHKANLTQERLAEALKTSRLYVVSLEQGYRAPSPPMLRRLADTLGQPPLWFLDAETVPTLVQLRSAAGLFQRAAAERVGISDQRLAQIELGHCGLSAERAGQLADLYQVSTSVVAGAHDRARKEHAAAMSGTKTKG
jgi:transcriptional regulator with XRE-family HTH domain